MIFKRGSTDFLSYLLVLFDLNYDNNNNIRYLGALKQ